MKRKVYIVTGANRGLGKAFVAILMQKKDSFVISISRSMSEEQRGYSPEKFYFLEADLSNGGITEKITVLKNMIDKEDIWFINNASIIEPIVKMEDITEDAIDKTIAVNIKSTMLMTKYLLRHFNDNQLTFVNISSGAAKRAIPHWSLYCSSKAFTEMFFNVAESEYDQHRFFNINPGVMDTGMQKSIRETDFPDVSSFKSLQEDGELKSPLAVAKEILTPVL
jgi:benzil reductase ((S)-benzoin forming)